MSHEYRTDITADHVRRLLDYNPETGEFVWKGRSRSMFRSDWAWKQWNHRYAGKSAGRGRKHVKITIFNNTYSASRLAYLLTFGEWPEGCMKDKTVRSERNPKVKLPKFEDLETTQNVTDENRDVAPPAVVPP